MAPTICSEKKQQHQRSNHHHHHAQHCHHHQQQQQQHQHQHHQQLRIKDLRRRVELTRNASVMATTASSLASATSSTKGQSALTNTTSHHHHYTTATATTTTTSTTDAVGSAIVAASAASGGSALTTSAAAATRVTPSSAAFNSSTSNLVDFVVAKGAMNSATAAATASIAALAWRQRRRGHCAAQLRAQISDNAVSSSTHLGDNDDVDNAADGDDGDDGEGEEADQSVRYMHANGMVSLSPDSSTHTPASSSPSFSPNESESSESYELGDSDTTMDVDDVVGDATKRIHSSSVRSRRQAFRTVLKAKETKNGNNGAAIGGYHHQQQQQHQTNTSGLLGIAIKTIKLVQRNQLLQRRLAQLQMETSEFIASVLANPENRHFREKINNAPATTKQQPPEPKQRGNMLLRH